MIFAMILGFRFVFVFSAVIYVFALFLIRKKLIFNK